MTTDTNYATFSHTKDTATDFRSLLEESATELVSASPPNRTERRHISCPERDNSCDKLIQISRFLFQFQGTTIRSSTLPIQKPSLALRTSTALTGRQVPTGIAQSGWIENRHCRRTVCHRASLGVRREHLLIISFGLEEPRNMDNERAIMGFWDVWPFSS
jgi:hypothetical protein